MLFAKAVRGLRDFVWAKDIWLHYPGRSIMPSFFGKGSIRRIFANCNVAFGDCESPLESKQSQLVSWSCPAYGIVGVNTDGSSLGNLGRSGDGGGSLNLLSFVPGLP
ncbi:hypothetical protein NC652_009658 [Populus alba x Populus x berolinensis]|nr:hypothetical protein NC652_009658 [Populus alba x Populus x berolinensis]